MSQTYYLTVELSYPEFKMPPAQAPRHSRGGYYKSWLGGDITNPPRRESVGASARTEEPEAMVVESDPEREAAEDDEDDDETLEESQPKNRDKGKGVARDDGPPRPDDGDDREWPESRKSQKRAAEAQPPQNIQILDLHSPHPLISYRGRLFEGSWAEVIGSELVLAAREDGSSLPALRYLPGGVDLLAASASRIMTTERVLEARDPGQDTLAPIKEEWNIRIPTGKDKTGERRQQTRFLENLIALKKKKGEKDHPTVWATRGQGQDFRDDRGPDYRPRGGGAGGAAEDARKRRRKEHRRTGQPNSRPPGRRAWRASRAQSESSARDALPISTPTPATWGELASPQQVGEESGGSERVGEDG